MKRDINTRAMAQAKQLRTFSGSAFTDGRADLAKICQEAAGQIETEVSEDEAQGTAQAAE